MKTAARTGARTGANMLRTLPSFQNYSPRFRRKMQQSLIWATLSILLLVLGFETSLYLAVRRNVSRDRIGQLQQQIETPFKLLVENMIKMNLEGVRHLGEEGILDLTNPDELNKHMMLALSKVPLQGVLQIADEEGGELWMRENGSTWETRLVQDGKPVEWKRWSGTEIFVEEGPSSLEYDPREQAWFTGAQEQDVSWIIPSVLPKKSGQADLLSASGVTPAISASRRWRASGKIYVAALHLSLKEVMNLLLLFSGNPEGTIFGPFAEGGVIAVMSSEKQGKVQLLELEKPSDTDASDEPEAYTAIAKFMQQQWQQRPRSEKDPVGEVQVNNSSWWVGAKEMTLGTQVFWLGITVQENSLSPAIQREQRSVISVFISTIVLALVILGLQLRFFLKASKEIEAEYVQRQDKKQGILQLIERGESSRLEFKSTIRWNLKTGKAGKEIEIAWLKTVVGYLNSEGGTILLGVRDDGEVLGLATDNFQNEDRLLLHVNNLLKQHVGLEFVQFIEVAPYHVEDRQVLSIRCSPSKAAVFLKHNNDEQFYIRTGPSTLRLSGSEMLKYLTQQAGK